MVDSEQVLGCKAPMGLVLVLLLSSLLGPLGQAQAQDCEKPMRYTMSLTGEHIQKEHFPNGLVVTFECATGYRSTGGSGKTTCAAGTWTTSTLSCEKFNCGSLELVNGHVEYSEGTSFGSVATFSCKDGYILSGREKLTCGNTEWLGRTPTCSVVKCDSPPSVDKAEGPSPKRDLYDFASVVRYKCQKDYTINGSASLKCSSNGKFTPNPPTCLMVRCKAPYIPNGSQKSGARPPYVHRSLVEYECNPGFKMEGEGVMTCQLNSTWSSTPECKEFNCGSLELVNGHVEYSEGTSFGSLATFSCNDGYILSGRNRLLCGNTEWLGRTPNCIGAVFTKDLSAKIVKCDSPPSVDKAEGPSPKRDFYDFESVVRYNCQKDYTINGSASLKCKSNGEFTPNPPTCLMVRCKAPFIPNGSQKSGARPPYIHRSLVEYECKPGFKMEGEGVMTCQLDSTWSSTPECKEFNCGSLELLNGHVEYSEGTSFGSVATFSCKDGYILSGRNQLICGNTEWLGRTPTCSVVKCDSPPSVDKAEGPSPKRDLYDFASVVRYKCQKDYTINGSASLKCSSNGEFTPNPPTCLMVRCNAPFIPNGSQKSGALPSYVHRSLVEYECNPGFKMEGKGVLICQLNSTWSSTSECKAIIITTTPTTTTTTPTTMTPKTPATTQKDEFNCGSLELLNGHVEYSEGTSFGSLATFSCKDGYILSGSEKLTCGNTEWLGRTPTCSVVKCDSPPSVDKAEGPSPKRDLYDFASVVRYKCQKDYTINGSASLKCSSNGKFTPNPPTCLMVRCKAPYIPNGSQKSGARPPYVHRSLVEYECNPGFKMEGEGVMTCQLNSTWSSTPECKAIIITTTPTTTTTTPTTMTPKTPATTQKDVLPVDPTSSPGDSKTSSQFLWFLVLVPIVLAVAIGLTLKKRGSQSLRAPVPLEEDKIL
ncbi:sushi, von Willebrand factor type A, EGF and pentraxin domain-containing protein 1 isoform X2 [Gadus morhua]|uniref:sushi, von Willebrand factor type A, EGF and pentraxin domain-containing protein 1 isoform X2 n=1 Tax=Gadus morhua TaxID=8049 RepID=UPI0011B722BF|nr:sushi, von Willebrand factor type A, EGF and pentraxin domain-containing protein 1-like isoform X2 [Gadus morhua]